jgi:uncharacterized protein (TIGR00730 family)
MPHCPREAVDRPRPENGMPVEPESRNRKGTMHNIRSICVYCGSQDGTDPAYLAAARTFGTLMARRGLRLVYGAGAKGIMGAIARSVLENGGEVTGIIPEFLLGKEASHGWLPQLTEAIVTADMHERKHIMFDRADAFVALPGGIGTLEELIEILTWAQLARHHKPIGLLNVKGFWDPLLTLLDHMRDAGFIHTQSRVRPVVGENPERLLNAIAGAPLAADDVAAERRIERM